MAHEQEVRISTQLSKCDSYFETIQSRKKLRLCIMQYLQTK